MLGQFQRYQADVEAMLVGCGDGLSMFNHLTQNNYPVNITTKRGIIRDPNV